MMMTRMMQSEIDSPRLLQPPPRFRIDGYLPVAIWQPPRGLAYGELDRNQGTALFGNFNIRHRFRQKSLPVLAAGSHDLTRPARLRFPRTSRRKKCGNPSPKRRSIMTLMEFTQRFAVFDEAAFLNYARTLGGVVDEDDYERKLVTAVMLVAPNGHASAQPSREWTRLFSGRRGRFAG